MASNTDRKMSDLAVNWKDEIGAIAGPFLPTDTKESWLGRAHAIVHKLNPKVSFRLLRDLFHGYASDPKYSVGASILSAAEEARLQEARCDALKVAGIYRRSAEALATIDPDFHRPEIDALLTAARVLSGGDRAGDHRAVTGPHVGKDP